MLNEKGMEVVHTAFSFFVLSQIYFIKDLVKVMSFLFVLKIVDILFTPTKYYRTKLYSYIFFNNFLKILAALIEDDSKKVSKSTLELPSSLSVIHLITRNGTLSSRHT